MSAWYDIVNPSKRQYLDIGEFGENFKWSGLAVGSQGRSIHAMAVTWLTCRFQTSGPPGPNDLRGAWSGDIIFFASDEAPPDIDGLLTSKPGDPDRNLVKLAHEEFEDITPRIVQALCCHDEEIAGILVGRVTFSAVDQHPCSLMRILGRIAKAEPYGPIETALNGRFGKQWVEIYEKSEPAWLRQAFKFK